MSFRILLCCCLVFAACFKPKSAQKPSEPQKKSAPNPLTYYLQSEDRPVKAFMLSEPTDNQGKKDPKMFPAVVEIARAIGDSMAADQKLLFLGSPEAFDKVAASFPPAKKEQLKHLNVKPYMWLQDLFEVYENGRGDYELHVPGVNSSLLARVDELAQHIPGALGEEREVHVRHIPTFTGIHGTTGGNFERWLDHVGFVGSSDLDGEGDYYHEDDDPMNMSTPNRWAEVFGNGIFSNKFSAGILQTSWMYLGHLDEVVKPILFKKNPCSVTALINAPRLAIELLEKNPKEPLVHQLQKPGRKNKDIISISQLCRDFKIKNCEQIKMGDLLEGNKKVGDFLTLQSIAASSQAGGVISPIHMHMELLEPKCEIHWVEVPALYLGTLEKDGEYTGIKYRSGSAVFPSLTNGLMVNGTYVVLDPGNRIFRQETEERLKAVGVKVRFVAATRELFDGGAATGQLHCMSQLIRK